MVLEGAEPPGTINLSRITPGALPGAGACGLRAGRWRGGPRRSEGGVCTDPRRAPCCRVRAAGGASVQTGTQSRRSEGGAQARRRRDRLGPATGGSGRHIGAGSARDGCALRTVRGRGGAGRGGQGRGLGRQEAGGSLRSWLGRGLRVTMAARTQRRRGSSSRPSSKGWGPRW